MCASARLNLQEERARIAAEAAQRDHAAEVAAAREEKLRAERRYPAALDSPTVAQQFLSTARVIGATAHLNLEANEQKVVKMERELADTRGAI